MNDYRKEELFDLKDIVQDDRFTLRMQQLDDAIEGVRFRRLVSTIGVLNGDSSLQLLTTKFKKIEINSNTSTQSMDPGEVNHSVLCSILCFTFF